METIELNRIAKKLEQFELELRDDYGLTKINGGFVHITMDDYDDDFVYITIKDGIQNDVENSVNLEETKLYRATLEFTN
jgi:hypothetical protein